MMLLEKPIAKLCRELGQSGRELTEVLPLNSIQWISNRLAPDDRSSKCKHCCQDDEGHKQ